MDARFRVNVISASPNPQQIVYAAMHQDYSEGCVYDEIGTDSWPDETRAGEIAVSRLLKGGRGHYGCTEHPQIVLSTAGFPHSVMQQARTHRVGCCLSGDTEVEFGHSSIGTGQLYYRKTIKELADLWHRGRSHQKTASDALYMQKQISGRKLLQINTDTGMVKHVSITNIYENGPREVWLIKFSGGQEIKATLDHKVFTPSGWKKFGELIVGDQVMSAQSLGRNITAIEPDLSSDIAEEEWRVVPGFNWYEVSSCGRLRSWAPRKHRGKLVVPKQPRIKKLSGRSSMTYLYASLQGEGGSSVRRNIHSLVLEAFVSNKPDGAVARHINGNSFDNRLLNLTWGSQQENANDRSFHKVSRAKKALPVSITSFEKVGFEDTYDLEVEGPFHNFIGNGIVVHNSFDVQSMRYTGDRIVRAASRELNLEDVFYLRPVGSYTDRKGHKYTYTEETRSVDLQLCLNSAVRYAELVNSGFAEEHARGILPFDFRQNFVVSFNLRSALHFLDLRAKLDAQLEIRQFCELMLPHLHNWAPEIVTWYEENRLGKARLSP